MLRRKEGKCALQIRNSVALTSRLGYIRGALDPQILQCKLHDMKDTAVGPILLSILLLEIHSADRIAIWWSSMSRKLSASKNAAC